jgi:hypothetical protein
MNILELPQRVGGPAAAEECGRLILNSGGEASVSSILLEKSMITQMKAQRMVVAAASLSPAPGVGGSGWR